MKKLIILSIFIFLLCFIRIDNKSYLKQIDLFEANEFLNKKQNNYPKPVTNFDLSKQNNNYQEADFLKYDNNYIYFLNNNVLNIFDMNNNYLIKSLSFNDFYCYQLLINDNDIILMGSKTQKYNIIPGRQIYYEEEDFTLYFINKINFNISRTIIFYQSIFLESVIVNNKLYLILTNNNIFDEDNKSFKYPKYYDSFSQEEQLNENNLYLNETGDNIYSLLLIACIDNSINVTGYLGMSSFIRIIDNKLFVSNSLYLDQNKTTIHVFSLNNFSYINQITLDGYLVNKYCLYCYDNYLRIILSNYQGSNYIYNISLIDYKIKDYKSIAPNENIMAIYFENNYCFLTSYLYIDPLFIVDFSNPYSINIKEKYLPYIGNNIFDFDDKIILLSSNEDNNKIIISLIKKNNLEIEKELTFTGTNIFFEAIYNKNDLVILDNELFTFSSEENNNIFYKIDLNNLSIKEKINFNNEYILRCIITKNAYIITNENIYIYSLKDFTLIKKA